MEDKVYYDNGEIFQCNKHTTIVFMLIMTGKEDWLIKTDIFKYHTLI